MGADAGYLNHRLINAEPGLARSFFQGVGYRGQFELTDAATGLADQQLYRIFPVVVMAGDESIEAGNPVNQAHRHEKIERPVDSYRSCVLTLLCHHLQDIIGTGGLMAAADNF